MQQLDLFDKTLEMKLYRLEKWVGRLNKEIWWLKNVAALRSQQKGVIDVEKEEQMDLFGA
jgi:hypothetical protein